MDGYTVEYDTIDYGRSQCIYQVSSYEALIPWVEGVLSAEGGGHADIFNENGDFVEDVEV